MRSRVPTLTMASITGTSSFPKVDNEYSTDGGEEAIGVRLMTAFSSSDRKRVVSILGEMRAMSFCNSPNRRGPPLSCQTMLGVHAPPSSFMHSFIGQPGGGGGATLLRIFRPIYSSVSVTEVKAIFVAIRTYSLYK